MRKFPYPYKAMLAICSDLDETPDREVYWESTRFLNTDQVTSMGPGVDLEVGNTIYFDMPQDQFAYWNTDETGRVMIHNLIQSGHIDCLHSFGDFATHRRHAGRALDALAQHNCRLEVWIDHATAPTNFGSDIMQGMGDIAGADAYHADLSIPFGIKYIWTGRVTSITGQNTKRSFSGILNPRRLKASSVTLFKEMVKVTLAQFNHCKYALHKSNAIYRSNTLRDDQKVIEFMRSNPHWRGISHGDNATGIAEVITDEMLGYLVNRRGASIIYTHLGKVPSIKEPFNRQTRKAFRRLAMYVQEKKILVTTTRRLLGYMNAIENIKIGKSFQSGGTVLSIHYDGPRSDLDGISIFVDDPEKTSLYVNNHMEPFMVGDPVRSGTSPCIIIPWNRLEFPQL